LWEDDRIIKQKGLKLTTLAIIGSGIVGRSLLFHLTKENFPFDEILLFDSPEFTPSCSLNSTAIAALRGITSGHSPLGDLILNGFQSFCRHIEQDSPEGVYPIFQYSAHTKDSEVFLKRYPDAQMVTSFDEFNFFENIYISREKAFMVKPPLYLDWLLKKSETKMKIKKINQFVTKVTPKSEVEIQTVHGEIYKAHKVVFAAGAASRFWLSLFPESLLKTSKPVQGAYLEFKNFFCGDKSFSLTLDGANVVYRHETKEFLIGSSSQDVGHFLAPENELREIYSTLRKNVQFEWPHYDQGQILVGHREKAKKREPYIINKNPLYFLGGLYKNGFTLSYKITEMLTHQLRENS